ncbi:MAG: hypothetical protein Q8L66_02535 [Caulobacter sp.]|nr:hypothetical protein [Caulobacter sp.]
MSGRKKYVFKINGGHTVETFPMERLALYLADLAKMLGEPESVHFVEITEGSKKLAYAVDEAADLIVEDRIEQIARGEADVVYMEAYRSLNKRLREDRTEGEIYPEGGVAILPFPGITAPAPVEFSGIPKVGHIDGVVIRVGGRREEIHIMVQAENGIFSKCVTSKAVAKLLANHMFDDELRLHGSGRWSRGETGQWTLQKFVISHFELLDQTPLSQVIADVREMGKDAWIGDNLWAEATDIRGKPN